MQKKLIALAIAGLASTAVFAQSNVTIYGIADVYAGHASADGKTSQNVINSGGWSGSRLGFKGSEDLGDGLKTIFVLEYGLNMDANSGIGAPEVTAANTVATGTQARQQLVGLTGNFGTAVAGRAQTAGYDFSNVVNPLHGTAFNPTKAVYTGLGGTLVNSDSRANNAFAYTSPDFSGFKVAYNHARVTEAANANGAVVGGSAKDNTANLLSGTYTSGPLALTAIYTRVTMDATVANDDVKELGFGGSYDFGMVKLHADYQTTQVGSASKNKLWALGATVPVSAAGNVVFSYAANKKDSSAASDNTKAWTLAYQHNLSKRTMLYAAYERVTNDTAAANGVTVGSLTPTAGGEVTQTVAGVRHTF